VIYRSCGPLSFKKAQHNNHHFVVHVDRIRLCLNWSHQRAFRSSPRWYAPWISVKTEELGERLSHCPLQIPHGLTRTTRSSAVRGRRPTTWAMAWSIIITKNKASPLVRSDLDGIRNCSCGMNHNDREVRHHAVCSGSLISSSDQRLTSLTRSSHRYSTEVLNEFLHLSVHAKCHCHRCCYSN
jgi:hypothetical protein